MIISAAILIVLQSKRAPVPDPPPIWPTILSPSYVAKLSRDAKFLPQHRVMISKCVYVRSVNYESHANHGVQESFQWRERQQRGRVVWLLWLGMVATTDPLYRTLW